ncbi:MAG: hypothetical protein WCV99_04870 [Sterolibacterium sp.]|jgi:photosystem II stability/assembly factor-like uncharacterized protein
MFNLHRVLGCAVLVLAVSVSDPAVATGWVNLGGPLGGLGYDVRIHPGNKNIMYVTDNFAGVSKSLDAGQTWTRTNSGITTKGGTSGDAVNIFSLTMDPNDANTIWAGTFGEGQSFGVFKSSDAGATWTRKTNGIALGDDAGLVFRGFTIQQGNSNVVYAQAEVFPAGNPMGWIFQRVKGRVYKTVDGGENWQLVWQGNDLARYVIIDPGDANTLYVSHGIFDREPFDSDCANRVFAGVGVLKSGDAGKTWSAINNGLTDLTVGSLRMHPTNSQVLFAATGNIACSGFGTPTYFSGVFRTMDGGATWTKVIAAKDGEPFTTVNFSPSNPNTLYAGSPQGFYRSDDLGSTWTEYRKADTPAYGPPGIVAGFPIDVVVDPDNADTVFVNNYAGGVFRSLDGTATWQTWSKGYTGAGVRRMAVSTGNPAFLAVVGKSGPFVSPNQGNDWEGILNGDAATLSMFNWATIAVHPANPALILLTDSNAGVIFRSTDNGNTFSKVFKDPNAEPIGTNDPSMFQGFRGLAFAASNPNIVYAGVSVDTAYHTPTPIGTVIYKSADGGENFTAVPSILDGNNVNRLIVDPNDANKVYAATTNGIYKSADGAASWTRSTALGSRKIEALAMKSGTLVAGEVAGGIWTSSDDGVTWSGPNNTGINSPNPYIAALAFDAVNANIVYAGDLYSGVYKSGDNGLTWSPFPDATMSGLDNRAINDLVLTNEALYAATEGGGVFRYDFPPTAAPTCTLTATPSTISAGSSATLSANCGSSTTAYAWTGGSCAGATAASCTVTPTATTTYSVAGTNAFGTGAATSATVSITAAVTQNPSDCLFNWAENTYPLLFAPAGATSASYAPYYFRYYSGTTTYLATSSADNHIWVLGPATGNTLFDVGPLTALLAFAGCTQ